MLNLTIMELILYSAAFILLVIGSLTDLKKREVPDWVSYAAIAFGFGARLIFSLVAWSTQPVVAGILGFVPLLLFALLMYYTGQWGGGDSKVLMGIGMLLGMGPEFSTFPLLAVFFVNVMIFGSLYGLIYSFYLAIKNRKRFVAQFKKELSRKRRLSLFVYAISSIILLAMVLVKDSFLKLGLAFFTIMIVCIFYTWLFLKSMEKTIMLKIIPIEALTEGDWIAKEIKIDARYICGPKDLGIEKRQIAQLLRLKRLGKIKTIQIKEGIPFVPGFLLAFIATVLLGNWLYILLI